MKKIKIFSLFVCLAMLVIACHNDDDERGVQMRTVLVYIAGDNSLRRLCYRGFGGNDRGNAVCR